MIRKDKKESSAGLMQYQIRGGILIFRIQECLSILEYTVIRLLIIPVKESFISQSNHSETWTGVHMAESVAPGISRIHH